MFRSSMMQATSGNSVPCVASIIGHKTQTSPHAENPVQMGAEPLHLSAVPQLEEDTTYQKCEKPSYRFLNAMAMNG